MPAIPRRRSRPGHLVLCGDDTLVFRMAQELSARYGEDVTVILPSRERSSGRRIAQLPGVRVLERPEPSNEALHDAGIGSARALALLHHDDMRNFHAALRAREINPGLRLVVNIFNTSLGGRVQFFLPDCAVLSTASVAAPSFVAAALGQPAPSHVRLAGRTLFAGSRGDVDSSQVICGIASTAGPGPPTILPEDQENADLVLAVADGQPRDPLARRHRSPLRVMTGAARALLGRKLGIAFLVLLAVLVTGFVVLVAGARYSWPNALYLTLLDVAGAAVTNVAFSTPERVAQVMLTFDGMAFIPTVTAAIVSARLGSGRDKRLERMTGHVIVVGLGKVGMRVVGQLHDLGIRVVCVDLTEHAFGVPMARQLGIPVVVGPSDDESTLRAARIEECRALVCVTSEDSVNLETAMQARMFSEKLRIVLRLFDDGLAQRVEHTVGGDIVSRSVSYLAAPSFAVALLEHQVLRTIPVGRRVLLIADVPVAAGSELAGCPLQEVHEAGQARVIALQQHGTDSIDWAPQQGYRLAPEDRLTVLATRAGLGQVLARGGIPAPEPGLISDLPSG